MLPPDKIHSRLPGVGAAESHLHEGIYALLSGRGFLVAPVLDCLSLGNNPYATMAYFGVI